MILLTGAAGFIGFHVAKALLTQGEQVLGIDNMNSYYDPKLKKFRLDRLADFDNFKFVKIDIAQEHELLELAQQHDIDRIVHLAAQAGVRYSLKEPFVYADSNLQGHLAVLEVARSLPGLKHMVYASSSSVYGRGSKAPFSEDQPADKPLSLYAATKRANELMSESYNSLYSIPLTGLRFFTVYGPWGRPDMTPWLFTDAILKGEEIDLYNNGDLKRDFTYIDDIVSGVVKCLETSPSSHEIYNLGNSKPIPMREFIGIIEEGTGAKAKVNLKPAQPGDMQVTCADVSKAAKAFGYSPKTGIAEGMQKFIEWFKEYNR